MRSTRIQDSCRAPCAGSRSSTRACGARMYSPRCVELQCPRSPDHAHADGVGDHVLVGSSCQCSEGRGGTTTAGSGRGREDVSEAEARRRFRRRRGRRRLEASTRRCRRRCRVRPGSTSVRLLRGPESGTCGRLGAVGISIDIGDRSGYERVGPGWAGTTRRGRPRVGRV